jgi:hypothetical protein
MEQFNEIKELEMESDEKVKLIEKFRGRGEDARRCEEGDELTKLPRTGASSEQGECDEELFGLVDSGSFVFLFTVYQYLIE